MATVRVAGRSCDRHGPATGRCAPSSRPRPARYSGSGSRKDRHGADDLAGSGAPAGASWLTHLCVSSSEQTPTSSALPAVQAPPTWFERDAPPHARAPEGDGRRTPLARGCDDGVVVGAVSEDLGPFHAGEQARSVSEAVTCAAAECGAICHRGRCDADEAAAAGFSWRSRLTGWEEEITMCRWLAYSGSPVRLEELLYKPQNSLIMQSLHSRWAPSQPTGTASASAGTATPRPGRVPQHRAGVERPQPA